MELSLSEFYKLYPRGCVVVSTASPDGKSNAAPFSFNSPISFSPPLFGISCNPSHDTWRNIKETKEFVVNFVDESFGKLMHILERDYPYGVSEIEKAGLTEAKSRVVKAPRIAEAYAWLECRLFDTRELGDHIWITGEVVYVEAKEDCYEKALDLEKCKSLLHVSGKYFAIPEPKEFKRA